MMPIHVKRIYEAKSSDDGYRVLVDRLWPRGIKKEEAHIDEWLKDVAPSPTLRKWFNHQTENWELFCKRYCSELQASAAFAELKNLINKHKTVTLLYAAKDPQHNQAIVLQRLLQSYGSKSI
jgi:uncharacterized protein YeaO (DUF488 family)